MNHTAAEQSELVDDVVAQLTTLVGAGDGTPEDLRDQMQRAAEEFDSRSASSLAKALMDSLCEDPGDVERLEALIVLGLAHPDIVESHRISLAVEGRRLAVLLERAGDGERARALLELLSANLPDEKGIQRDLAAVLRRTGETETLIERYLLRADEAIDAGKPMDAIPWLQEVLLHDRSRRDIATLIRELRENETRRRGTMRRRLTLSFFAVVLSSLVTVAVIREKRLHEEYKGLPAAAYGDLASTQRRLDEVERMIDKHKAWAGVFQAITERGELRTRVDKLEAEAAEAYRQEIERQQRNLIMAEAARKDGLKFARRGEYDEALVQLRRALELSPSDWPHRERIEVDIAAIVEAQEGDQ